MDITGGKAVDPTMDVAEMRVLDLLLGEVNSSGVPPVVHQMPGTPDVLLSSLNTVEEVLPKIKEMLEWEAANSGKKAYPRAMLRQQHIIAFMLAQPFATTPEICRFFSISPTTLSNITKSDTFKAAVNKFAVDMQNLQPEINDQLKDTLQAAITVVQRDLVERQDPDFALQVLDKTANRLGMGTKQQTNVQINNNIVTPDMIKAARAGGQRRLENNGN